ncbi:MAG: DEAD/DEAH box helicase, partial [Myxococcota bacterium]|nr:DEAD/DEAH box helicase [Myxococcota bacterium]
MNTLNRSDVVGRRVLLPGHFAEPVVIDDVEDPGFGDVLIVKVRTTRGKLEEASVEAGVLAAAIAAASTTAPTYVKPDDQFLLVESARIRLAYAWDPYFAVSLSGIEALPHQLEAVYDRMLQQARLRFLLADDPGVGKTIMAGLLFKELRLRGAVERALILAPAPLAIQWQDEMRSKFDEVFELIDSHAACQQLGGSPWARFPLCVASIDFAKQEHVAPDLLTQRWDLVIIDEAHKLGMADIEHPTMRFKLGSELAGRTERLLLLTATPHQGNPEQFRNFIGCGSFRRHGFHPPRRAKT